MALIQCSECARDVSDKAAACPNCGAPVAGDGAGMLQTEPPMHMEVTRSGGKWEGIGFILIVVGMLTAMIADAPLSSVGGMVAAAGFVVFIIGRCK